MNAHKKIAKQIFQKTGMIQPALRYLMNSCNLSYQQAMAICQDLITENSEKKD
jgi:hypothetical protein